jgi:hypothetical protein
MDLSRARRTPFTYSPASQAIESLTFKYNEIKWGNLLSEG